MKRIFLSFVYFSNYRHRRRSTASLVLSAVSECVRSDRTQWDMIIAVTNPATNGYKLYS
jgi:hypothetical protein